MRPWGAPIREAFCHICSKSGLGDSASCHLVCPCHFSAGTRTLVISLAGLVLAFFCREGAKVQLDPGLVAQLVGASSCTPKGFRLDSQSGRVWEATDMFLSLSLYMYRCIYIDVYVYIYIYLYIFICIYPSIDRGRSIYVCVRILICVFVCIYIDFRERGRGIYICIRVCVYVCIYITLPVSLKSINISLGPGRCGSVGWSIILYTKRS